MYKCIAARGKTLIKHWTDASVMSAGCFDCTVWNLSFMTHVVA